MLRSLANGRAAWFAFKSLMPFSVLIAVLLMTPDIVDDSSWSQATEQLPPCLMALGLACVVARSYWQEFRRSLSHQELLLDDLALLRGRHHPAALLSDVYIAGHRVGFPGTRSSLLFRDLDELRSGDAVILHDSDERPYEYRVFARRTVDPDDISVTDPVPRKSVVSLQTCTLPDYARRLVVRAELVSAPPDTAAGAPLAPSASSPARTHGAPR